MSKPRFTVSAQKGESDDYIFYRGQNFNEAVKNLKQARKSVAAASSGHVHFAAYAKDTDSYITLVFEEVGK